MKTDCLNELSINQAAIVKALQSDSSVKDLFLIAAAFVSFAVAMAFFFIRFVRKNERTAKVKDTSIVIFNTLSAGLILLYYGVTIVSVKFLILLTILTYASITDIKKHEVEDFVSIMILISSFIGIDIKSVPKMAIGFLITFLLLVTISFAGGKNGKSIGGADIKIASSLSFCLGLIPGIYSLMLGTVISCIVIFVMILAKKHEKGKPYALIPFLNVGAAMILLIYQ